VLLPAPEAADPTVRLVLTLRADFLPVLQSIPGFHTRLNGRLYLLSPMTAEQLRLAVECPARAREVSFQPPLVDQILRDAESGALSLLEFTLTKLWETQRHRTLTFAGYQEMGGVSGALDRFAGERAALLAQTPAEVLDRVLLRLVRTPGGGSDLATRQRVLQAEVPAAEWDVLRRLADARLVNTDTDATGDQPYAELAHDILITAWRRLRDLVADNAEFLNWLARVRQRAAEGDPLPEARIAEARRWLGTRPGSIPDDVRRFVDSSETAAEARLRELREATDRAETARQHAETARQQAEMAARRAEALRLAGDAEVALRPPHSSLTVALALGAESVLTSPTLQGDLALRHVLRLHPRTLVRLDHDRPVRAVAFSPDGSRVATASRGFRGDGLARVFDAVGGTELARFDYGDGVNVVAFSPDGTRVAVGSGNIIGGGSARVFDAATGTELARLVHGGPVFAVAFSPDGAWVATGGIDHSARVFDVATGDELARLDHRDAVSGVAFSPDGTQVATSSRDRSVRVFTAATGTELARIHVGDWLNGVAFSPDGVRVATASADVRGGLAQVFEAATGSELTRFQHDNTVNAVAFSPDGAWLATGGRDRSARVFDVATGREVARVDHEDTVNAVAFSPDGTRVATGSSDGWVRVFEVTPDLLVQRAMGVMTRPLNASERRRYSLPPDCRHVRQWALQPARTQPGGREIDRPAGA
jgi:WD40 repeat protein